MARNLSPEAYERQKARSREYYYAHREATLARQREYYREHREEILSHPPTIDKEKKRQYDYEYWRANAEKRHEQVKRWTEANKSRIKNQRLMRTYGISLADYDALFDAQDGRCAICGSVWLGGIRLHVDHDHETGRVRGLLCSNCNTAIGLLGEDAEIISHAASYLRGDK